MGHRVPRSVGRSGANRYEGFGAASSRRKFHDCVRQGSERLPPYHGVGNHPGVRGHIEDVTAYSEKIKRRVLLSGAPLCFLPRLTNLRTLGVVLKSCHPAIDEHYCANDHGGGEEHI